jgi:hypothetical protein
MRHDDTDYHIDAFLEKLGAMSLEELERKLPLAQNSLDAIEVELDELLALRDAHVIRVAAITTRLATLKQIRPLEVAQKKRGDGT